MRKLSATIPKKTAKVKTSKPSKPRKISKASSKKTGIEKKKVEKLNFSLPWVGKEKSQKNFNTNFEYGDLSVKIYSNVKGRTVTLNVKVHSKNFSFDGVASLNAKSFSDLETVFNHIKSNIMKAG